MKGDPDLDPRGLIHEAYRIDGIDEAECRSVFLDWAVGLPEGVTRAHIAQLLERYGAEQADHPMTAILRAGLMASPEPLRRRGGAAGRRG